MTPSIHDLKNFDLVAKRTMWRLTLAATPKEEHQVLQSSIAGAYSAGYDIGRLETIKWISLGLACILIGYVIGRL